MLLKFSLPENLQCFCFLVRLWIFWKKILLSKWNRNLFSSQLEKKSREVGSSKAICGGKRHCCARNYSRKDKRTVVVVLQIHIFHKIEEWSGQPLLYLQWHEGWYWLAETCLVKSWSILIPSWCPEDWENQILLSGSTLIIRYSNLYPFSLFKACYISPAYAVISFWVYSLLWRTYIIHDKYY